jgi:type I restriction enzyme, S subunit
MGQWKRQPLEQCIEPVVYTRKIPRKSFLDHGAFPIISQEEDFINGYWNDKADLYKVTTPVVVFGDHTKALKYVDFDFVLGADGVKILKPRDFLLPKYFYYQLLAARLDSLGYARHYRLIKEIQISYPSHMEQKRIVGILEDALARMAAAKGRAERNIGNARALFVSHLHTTFKGREHGWVERKILEVAQSSLGKMLDKAKNKGVPRPYLRNLNVRWFEFNLTDLLMMPFLPEETSKYTVVKGDVVICEGGYPGRAAVWNEDYPIHFQKALHRVRFHQPEYAEWFVYFLYSEFMHGGLKRYFSGTGIQHLTGESLAQLSIPFPPPSEIRPLVARFGNLSMEVQRLESIYQQKVIALKALEKSVLHQGFSGRL